MKYFSCKRIINTLDAEKIKPEVFFVESLRTDGKTTSFLEILIGDFLKEGKKFGYIVRFANEIEDVAGEIQKKGRTNFKDIEVTQKTSKDRPFGDFYINGQHAGYILPLSLHRKIKLKSGIVSDCDALFFDEFQPSDNKYLKDEMKAFISLHVSIARGENEAVRYVPVYMACNRYTIFNPYYVHYGITERLSTNTKILRGKGWVYQYHHNPDIQKEQEKSRFLAGIDESLKGDVLGTEYLFGDPRVDIKKVTGEKRYFLTVKDRNKYIAFYYAKDMNCDIIYVSEQVDLDFPRILGVSHEDAVLTSGNANIELDAIRLKIRLRALYMQGKMRFQNANCKHVFVRFVEVKDV